MLAKGWYVEVHQQAHAEPLQQHVRPELGRTHREQRLDGLELEHHAPLDDEVGLIRALDPALVVDEGQHGLPFEPHRAQLHLVGDALLVRRLQEPRPEVTMHFDARADDLVGIPSEAFPGIQAGVIGPSTCTSRLSSPPGLVVSPFNLPVSLPTAVPAQEPRHVFDPRVGSGGDPDPDRRGLGIEAGAHVQTPSPKRATATQPESHGTMASATPTPACEASGSSLLSARTYLAVGH